MGEQLVSKLPSATLTRVSQLILANSTAPKIFYFLTKIFCILIFPPYSLLTSASGGESDNILES